MKLNFIVTIPLLSRLAFCSPFTHAHQVHERDVQSISEQQLKQFELVSQYAAAAYCPTNWGPDEGGNKTAGNISITCMDNCPDVEQAKPVILQPLRDIGRTKTSGFIAVDKVHKLIVVSFEGTRHMLGMEAMTNYLVSLEETDWCGNENKNDGCTVHMGFLQIWRKDFKELITAGLKNALAQYPTPEYTVVFTGHSKGAALAAVGAVDLRNQGYKIDLYTFGQPRIGSEDISKYITNQAPAKGNNYRITQYDDPVCQIPAHSCPKILESLEICGEKKWKHISPEYWISTLGSHPKASDIKIIDPSFYNKSGNARFKVSQSDIETHGMYFGNITLCNRMKYQSTDKRNPVQKLAAMLNDLNGDSLDTEIDEFDD